MEPDTNYNIQYTNSFFKSLQLETRNRKVNFTLSRQQIQKFVDEIDNDIKDIAVFPYSTINIADKYNMRTDTHEILIDNRHAIFYRCNPTKKTILIGSLFSSRQMKLSFQEN